MTTQTNKTAKEAAADLLQQAKDIIASTTKKSEAFVLWAVMERIAGEEQLKEIFRK